MYEKAVRVNHLQVGLGYCASPIPQDGIPYVLLKV